MKSELQIIKIAFWIGFALTVAMFAAHCLLQYAQH